MSLHPVILKRLTASANDAAEAAIATALAYSDSVETAQLAAVLLTRNRRAGWVILIRFFHRLPEAVQTELLGRPRELFGPLSEAMGEAEGAGRANVIAIVRQAAHPRFIGLLTEALSDTREEVRQLAADSLLEAIRIQRAAVGNEAEDAPHVDPDDLRRAIDFAIRQYNTHRQESVVRAALLLERQVDAPLWMCFRDSYDHATRAANNILRQSDDPQLAAAHLLALCSPLKPAASAGITFCENGPALAALAAQSFRLVDPTVRDAAKAVPHPRAMAAPRGDLGWQAADWWSWYRLIETLDWDPALHLNWLQRLRDLVDDTPHAPAAKLMILQALSRHDTQAATAALLELTRDVDLRVARSAARLLIRRRPLDWKSHAAELLQSPHASVRKLISLVLNPGQFERLWHEYAALPPAVQVTTARAIATTDAQFSDLLRSRLTAADPQQVLQGLRMLASLKTLTAYRDLIITLCRHPDQKVVASAVHLVGKLDDPKLRDLLEAAARHPDPRVRANAVEAMEKLHVTDKSLQVLGMLNSRFNRERANAIRALSSYNFAVTRECLLKMLDDPDPHHRISALWVVGQLEMLDIVRKVASMASRDPNSRVQARARDMMEKFEAIAGAVVP